MIAYTLQSENAKSIETGLTAYQLLSKKTSPDFLKEKALVQIGLSSVYLKTGKYDSAIKNALEAKTVFSKLDDNESLAAAAITLGNIYEMQEEYEKALYELNQALKINIENDNQKELAKTYNSIGNVYYALKLYNKALINYYKGYNIRKLKGFDDDLSGSLFNIGLVYELIGKPDSASKIYKQNIQLSLASRNIEGQYEAYRAMGSLLREQKKFNEAIDFFQKSLSLSSEAKSLPEILILLKEISRTYKQLGKSDSALIYTDKYNLLSDSINNKLRNAIRQEAIIKDNENELNLKDVKNKSQAYVITILFLVIVLMAVIIFIFIRNTIAKKRMRQLHDLIKEQELLAVDAMIEGQEIERKRLATELHDTIGSVLSAVKFSFKSMENSFVEIMLENKARYGKINDMLDEALGTVRRISHDMAAGVLENGIDNALQQLCETLQETGKINIRLDMYGFETKAESVTELNLYRIIQELLTNILKHSNAHNVSIQLIKSKENINLVVEDDGNGFDPNDPTAKNGIGLKNINTRVKKLSGKWNIDSGKGKGTTTVVDLPTNDNTI